MDVEITNLSLSYGDREVLKNLNASIPEGRSVALLGQSGAGKTTLLRAIAGLERTYAGSILVGGREPQYHHGTSAISFLFQEACLFPHLTVRQNLELSFHAQGKDPDLTLIQRKLQEVGLHDATSLLPHQLSIGMKARAAIARSLCVPPALLLMDEPFAALDTIRRNDLNRMVHASSKSVGASQIWTTHNVTEALMFADEIMVLRPNFPIALYFTNDLPPIDDEGALSKEARTMRDAIICDTWGAPTARI